MTTPLLCPRCGAQFFATPASHEPRKGSSILKTVAIVLGVLLSMMLALGCLASLLLFAGHAEPMVTATASPVEILRPAERQRAELDALSRALEAEATRSLDADARRGDG